jgi:hypothetical protein
MATTDLFVIRRSAGQQGTAAFGGLADKSGFKERPRLFNKATGLSVAETHGGDGWILLVSPASHADNLKYPVELDRKRIWRMLG